MSFISRGLLKTNASRNLQLPISRCFSKSSALEASQVAKTRDEDDPRDPIKYSTSEAGWMKTSIVEAIPTYPWYKHVILWGTFLFYVHYFMDFRPPNDLDEELDMPLGKRLLWVKELHLLDEKKALLASGSTTKFVDEELDKINELRKKYNYI